MKPADLHFFIDPNRCIGCQACVWRLRSIACVLVLTFGTLGCVSEADRQKDALGVRIANSIEAAEIGLKREARNDVLRTRYAEMLDAIKSATPESLATPRIMFAYVSERQRTTGPQRVMYVRWLSSQPEATGVRIFFRDESEPLDLAFAEGYIAQNDEDAKQIVMFYAGLPLDQGSESSRLLTAMLEERPRVALTKGGLVISEPRAIEQSP